MEPEALEGGCIIDWHSCEIFPQSWIDLVVVLRVNSTLLYDRLKARNYAENKLQENLDSEIMEVCLEEARESYDPQIVVELTSDTTEDMESNVERIQGWYEQWLKDNKSNA
jgi:adenylate kinase